MTKIYCCYFSSAFLIVFVVVSAFILIIVVTPIKHRCIVPVRQNKWLQKFYLSEIDRFLLKFGDNVCSALQFLSASGGKVDLSKKNGRLLCFLDIKMSHMNNFCHQNFTYMNCLSNSLVS